MTPQSVDSFESVHTRRPFVVRRRVRWSDCDPAGVVYTGKFAEYVLSAVNLFYEDLAPGSYRDWIRSLEVDTPCKGLEFTFHAALWPDDQFYMQCHVAQVRTHSYDLSIDAAQADGRRIFTARFSPICIRRDERRRAAIPPPLRAALQAMQR